MKKGQSLSLRSFRTFPEKKQKKKAFLPTYFPSPFQIGSLKLGPQPINRSTDPPCTGLKNSVVTSAAPHTYPWMSRLAQPQPTKVELIEHYKLAPHPEGGFYTESYRSEQDVQIGEAARSASTAIYFLVETKNVSRLHRIRSDEMWHFYLGNPLTVVELRDGSDVPKFTTLGTDVLAGQLVQYTVPRETWFGCFPTNGVAGSIDDFDYSFVGCTVAPGFVFEDFELGSRATLLSQFPAASETIEKLTEGLP